MTGTWERRGTVNVTQDSNIVIGIGTYWTDAQNGPQVGNTFYGPNGQAHEVAVIRSATELWLADEYKGATAAGVSYQIDTTRVDSVPGLASRVAAVLGFAQGQYDNLDKWTQGGVDEDVTLVSPNGESVTVPSLPKMGKDYATVAAALPAAERAEAAANRADVTAVDVNAKHADVVAMTAQVSSMRTEVETDARQASAASDTAAQKAAEAAEHEAAALVAAERAENAALANTGAVLDGGICDLSGGAYPPPITVGGDPYSSVWYVGGAGAVAGTQYDVGDVLRYTTANGGLYFRQDAKDDVYSVNGEKGEVVITPEKIGALPMSGGVASGHIFVDMGTDEEDPQIGLRRGPRTILMADSGSKVGLFTNGFEGVNGAWLISRLIATGVINVGDQRAPLALIGADEAPLYNGGRIYWEGSKPTIPDVEGLEEALQAATDQGGRISAVEDRVSVLEQRKSTCLVNATGTGAPHETVVTQLPANVVPSSRYVLPNPFGNNTPVICWAEVFAGGMWADSGFIFSNGSYGANASYVQGTGVVVQTGSVKVLTAAQDGGGGHGGTVNAVSAPCRVFVRKLEA